MRRVKGRVMAKGRGKNQRQKEESRHAYLVRSYEQEGFAGDSAGYYFSKEEAEDVKLEFEKLYPDYEYSIEEFERHNESANWLELRFVEIN